jgi:hypothetical protein
VLVYLGISGLGAIIAIMAYLIQIFVDDASGS